MNYEERSVRRELEATSATVERFKRALGEVDEELHFLQEEFGVVKAAWNAAGARMYDAAQLGAGFVQRASGPDSRFEVTAMHTGAPTSALIEMQSAVVDRERLDQEERRLNGLIAPLEHRRGFLKRNLTHWEQVAGGLAAQLGSLGTDTTVSVPPPSPNDPAEGTPAGAVVVGTERAEAAAVGALGARSVPSSSPVPVRGRLAGFRERMGL